MNRWTAHRAVAPTLAICFLAAVFEGIDLQAMGIASTKLIPEFGLSPAQYGTAASMSLIGLPIGSAIGGRVADAVGRARVLAGSLVLLGLFSLLTTQAGTYPQLLGVRFLVGIGLGGAFPTLLAIASAATPGEQRSTSVSIMYAGIPMGTVIGTLMTIYFADRFEWRWIFYLGGFGPFLVAPLVWSLEDPPVDDGATIMPGGRLTPTRKVLFGGGRATPTVLLWLSFFFTLLVIYLLTNWLNQLMAQRGFDHRSSAIVLLAFGLGSIVGGLSLGAVLDAGHRRYTATVTYAGVAAGLAGIALFTPLALIVAASAVTGFFAVGGQLINYALAPTAYPARDLGTGLGWTVSIGRIGSVCGPLFAGLLLGHGLSAPAVLLSLVPGLAVAAIAATVLLRILPADR